MNAVPGPGMDITSRARELLDHALQGAKVNGRPDLIRRLDRARQTLDGAANSDERRTAVRLVAEEVVRAVDSLRVDLRSRRAMLSDPARTARLRAELARVQSQAGQFKLASREWTHNLASGFARLSSDAEFDLRARMRDVVSDSELAISAGDPGKDRDQFDAELRARLVAEADLSYQRVHSGARAVASELAALLSLPAPHQVPALSVTPAQRLVAELPDRHRRSPKEPMPARLLKVMLPGYSGIVITLLLSRVLGPQLPGWLIAVCAVVGALALSGAKASGERKRQLDRRRADANKAMRSTADDFQLATAKQVRDSVRCLEQDLRRATTATVTRLGSAIGEELDSTRTAAEIAERAPAELATIGKDLDAVATLRSRALELRRLTSGAPGSRPLRRRHLTVVA